MSTAELEIHLKPRDNAGYPVEMRFRPADSDADNVLPSGRAPLDPDTLVRVLGAGCGPELTKQLFAEPSVSDNFTHARVAAQAAGAVLRIRLFVDPGAPELHAVFWELLRDPRDPEASRPLLLTQ